MDALKRVRRIRRSAFTKILNELNELLDRGDGDRDLISVCFELLQEKMTELCNVCDCLFHESQDCYKAKRMSLLERREIVKVTGACFNCLKKGHSFRRCKSKVKCAWCGKKHVLLMCPEKGKNTFGGENTDYKGGACEEQNLASLSCVPKVHLRTLCVRIVNGNSECVVRALIDSGSQRSYLTLEVIKKKEL